MSAEEFWKDDPQLFVSYRISFMNKKERELEEEDYKSWLRGLYIHDGNSKLFASLRQFITNVLASISKSPKDTKEIDTYPLKPYSELKKDKEKEQAKKEKELSYKEFEDSLKYYGTMKQRYLNNLKEKAKKGE